MNILAIDIGGTKFSVAAFQDNNLIFEKTTLTDRIGGAAWLVAQIEQLYGNWRDNGFIPHRCGIGFGGPVDFGTQRIVLSTHVEGWAGFPLVDRIQSLTGAPTIMDNDANVGALGEAHFGAGRDKNPLFYMTLSTGIGGGLIVDGKVLHGANSYAGEIGHITVDPDGPSCLCGSNGCLERLCCGLWLEHDHGRPAKELLYDDPLFVEKYVVNLARGLKSAIMLLNPARIVIGGGISKAGERLFRPLRAELNRQITSWSKAEYDVVPAALGDRSVLFGALVLAHQEP